MTMSTKNPDLATFPPGPETRSPLGHLFAFARDPLFFLVRLASDYGDLVHFRIRKRDVFLVNHPQEIERILVSNARNFVKNPGFQTIKRILGEGLLSSEGEFHLRQRRMMQPSFHRQRITTYGEAMSAEAQRASDRWENGAEIDLFREMSALTLTVAARTLFSTEMAAQSGEVGQALDDAMTLFHRAASSLSLVLDRLPWVGDRRFRRGKARLDAIIYHLIQARRASHSTADDLLGRLIAARDEDSAQQMSDQQLRDEALTILLAGHETTATGLAWTWYLLACHPEIQAALQAELQAALGDCSPCLDDLPRLTLTRAIFTEALRLYPPIYMLGRQALENYPIANYTIPAGASLIVSPYIVHHDPRWHPQPQRFNPQRWLGEAQAGRPHFSYFPFGGGPRVCIGEPFAWQEATLILATLAQHWQVRLVKDAPVEMLPRVTLRPKGSLPLRIERRS